MQTIIFLSINSFNSRWYIIRVRRFYFDFPIKQYSLLSPRHRQAHEEKFIKEMLQNFIVTEQ